MNAITVETTAILFHELHTGDYQSELSVVTHPVASDAKGLPVLGPGRVFSTADKQRLVNALNSEQSAKIEFLEARCIVSNVETMMWYRGREEKTEICVNGKYFKIALPSLVFLVHQGKLYVAAYKGEKRPTPDTALYDAPLPNLYSGGSWCDGGNKIPGFPSQADCERLEAMFFESPFTHMGGRDLPKKMSMGEYYGELETKKRYPTSTLHNSGRTLWQWLEGIAL